MNSQSPSISFLDRSAKESRIGQRGVVLWLFGLSGSGKSSLANGLERALHAEGGMTVIPDGDSLRAGLNRDLGFSDEDRAENVRRVAEVARLFAEQGQTVIVSVITPREIFRRQAREILVGDLHLVYVSASLETCAARDTKGLYASARAGLLPLLTGMGSVFEPPGQVDLTIDTETDELNKSIDKLHRYVRVIRAGR